MSEPIAEVRGAARSFGTTRALRDANLVLRPGEIHALMGENGAGKSTLLKILVGALRPDAGELRFNDRPLNLSGVADAIAVGLVPIYQHLTLFPHLSVRENLLAFDIAADSGLRTSPRRDDDRIVQMLEAVGLVLDPHKKVASLSIAEQQLVEIARGLDRKCRVLLLDEPTTTLNRSEVERLFKILRRICDEGRAVLFISHQLDEIERVADRITVLRDGVTTVNAAPRGKLTVSDIVKAMIGHEVDVDELELPPPGASVLNLRGGSVSGAFSDADLTLHGCEILGIVGLIGSGALELGEALAGAIPLDQGYVEVAGRRLAVSSRRSALRSGIGLIPPDRESEGMFPTLSVADNAFASLLYQISSFGWLHAAAGKALLSPWIRKLALSPADPAQNVSALSGGNQQKLLVIRALIAMKMRVLVGIEPTRGVDVGARETIHRALADAARQGLAIVVVSSDMEELLMLCHRVIIIRSGRIVAEVPRGQGPSPILRELVGAPL